MTKKEFVTVYRPRREQKLREIYKDDPHGPACLAMSLCDLPKEIDKLWRKMRPTLKNTSAKELKQMLEQADQEGV